MKKSLLFLCVIFACLNSFSQTQNWSWAQNAISSGNSDGLAMSRISNNCFYVTGEFFGASIGFGNIILHNAGPAGTNDLFVVKYSLAGNVLWAKGFGGSSNDISKSIAMDKDGNVFIAGGFMSGSIAFGTDTLANSGGSGANDAFIAKLSPEGNVLWANREGGMDDDNFNCVTVDNIGNAYVVGNYGSRKFLLGNDSVKNKSGYGSPDIFFIKYNAEGKLQWAKTASGERDDNGNAIVTDSRGNIYISGGTYSPELNIDSIKIPNYGYEKIFIAKFSSSGALQWAQTVGGSDSEEASCMAIDAEDNICITGKFKSASITMDTTTLINAGTFDIFIAKYSSSRNVLWAKSAGGMEDDRGNNIITDKAGNIYVTGWFASSKIIFGKTILHNPGNKGTTHMFVAKYSATGDPLWSETANSKGDDWGNAMELDSNGNIYLTGGFDGYAIDFSNTKLLNEQANDFFISLLKNID